MKQPLVCLPHWQAFDSGMDDFDGKPVTPFGKRNGVSVDAGSRIDDLDRMALGGSPDLLPI